MRATPFRPHSSNDMGADFVYDSETPSVIITHRKVRRSRCMCLLFLFLIAIFVGLVPIMVYRSLGVPLPRGLRNVRVHCLSSLYLHWPLTALAGISRQPWVIISTRLMNRRHCWTERMIFKSRPQPSGRIPRQTNPSPKPHFHPPKHTRLPSSTSSSASANLLPSP